MAGEVTATSELNKAYTILDTLIDEIEKLEGDEVGETISEPAFYRRLDTCIEIVEKYVNGSESLQAALDGLTEFSDDNNFGNYDDWNGYRLAGFLRDFLDDIDIGIGELE